MFSLRTVLDTLRLHSRLLHPLYIEFYTTITLHPASPRASSTPLPPQKKCVSILLERKHGGVARTEASLRIQCHARVYSLVHRTSPRTRLRGRAGHAPSPVQGLWSAWWGQGLQHRTRYQITWLISWHPPQRPVPSVLYSVCIRSRGASRGVLHGKRYYNDTRGSDRRNAIL